MEFGVWGFGFGGWGLGRYSRDVDSDLVIHHQRARERESDRQCVCVRERERKRGREYPSDVDSDLVTKRVVVQHQTLQRTIRPQRVGPAHGRLSSRESSDNVGPAHERMSASSIPPICQEPSAQRHHSVSIWSAQDQHRVSISDLVAKRVVIQHQTLQRTVRPQRVGPAGANCLFQSS